MLQDQPVVKYSTEYFEDNGPKLINRHGDWGVFIDGEQVPGAYFSRQDAYDAYAEILREQAEAEQTFVSGPEWPEPLTDTEMAILDGQWRLDHPADDYGLEPLLLPVDQLRLGGAK